MNPLRLLFNRNLSVASSQITTQISLSEKKKECIGLHDCEVQGGGQQAQLNPGLKSCY